MWFYMNYQNSRNRIFDNSQVTRGGLFHNTVVSQFNGIQLDGNPVGRNFLDKK